MKPRSPILIVALAVILLAACSPATHGQPHSAALSNRRAHSTAGRSRDGSYGPSPPRARSGPRRPSRMESLISAAMTNPCMQSIFKLTT